MELLGLDFSEFKRAWSGRQHKRMTGELTNFVEVIKDILNERNIQFNNEAIDLLYRERLKEKALPFLHIRSDIQELLQYLRDQHLKIGLISNCTEEEVRGWHDSKLAMYFDQVTFSYEAGVAKPDERIYKVACDKLGVHPNESIFIGDGGSDELQGAFHVGMVPFHARWFNSTIDSPYNKINSPIELVDEIIQLYTIGDFQ